MSLIFRLIFLIFVVTSIAESYRLSNDTIPLAYNVHITTNIHNQVFDFQGTVSIEIVAVFNTNSIKLHHRRLTILQINLFESARNIPVGNLIYDSETEILEIPLVSDSLIADRRYTLNITFNGVLQEEPRGFYRSSYLDDNGNRHFLATTQFAMTDARHGFPCYDEPSFRAQFTISITHGSNYNVTSNMPVENIVANGDMTTTTFHATPPSPTYTLAYTISNFIFRSNDNIEFIPIRTYTRSNAIDGVDYSIEIGEQLLKSFNDYFGVHFSLPKLDQVAVADFPFRGMENWGMIIYRERNLLLFPNSTNTARTDVTVLIAHEIAHQWFGNLVTPKWWTYAWLSEGLSTLFAHFSTSWIFPGWNMNDVFVFDTLQNVFQSDAENTTRPMSFYAESRDDILGLLDNIAYEKASCVLRMFMHALTENVFRRGLVNYFNQKGYSAAEEADLFDALAQSLLENDPQNQINIAEVMSSWTQQKGFPFLTIARNYDTGAVTIRQDRYQSYVPIVTDPALWWIPYNFVSASTLDFSITLPDGWISNTERSKTLPNSTWQTNEWIICNKQQTGYYRVLYDDENYELIIKELNEGNFSAIHLTSRSQLIDDAFNFARTGRLKYSTLFDMLTYLKREREYVPWASAFHGLSFLHRMMATSNHYEHLKEFTLHIVEDVFHYLGINDLSNNEPHFQKELRKLTTNWACSMGLSECLQSTSTELRQNFNNLSPNMRGTIYCNGLREGSDSDYSSVINLLRSTTDGIERNALINALGCSNNYTQLINFISDSINTDYLSETEKYAVFMSVLSNGQPGLSVAIAFLRNNFVSAATVYGLTNMNNAMISIASNIVSHDMKDEFSLLLAVDGVESWVSLETRNQTQLIIQNNFDWLHNHLEPIESWLMNHFHSSGSIISLSLITVVACYVFQVIM